MSKWEVTSGSARCRKVLVYMRGAIVECWEIGGRVFPLHSYKRFECKPAVVVVGPVVVEMSRCDT